MFGAVFWGYQQMHDLFQSVVCHGDFAAAVPLLLEALKVREKLAGVSRILLKPNLVNASPPPVTTPLDLVENLVVWLRCHTAAEIVIAEGCGDAILETPEIFARHGYDKLALRQGVELIDLNRAPLVRLSNPKARVFSEFLLPEIVMDSFVVSIAQLKAHSLADVTLTMKNMIGCAPPAYYQQGGGWKKAALHQHMHEAIVDLNSYRAPDLGIVDASLGLSEYHLGGAVCSPPVGRLLGGFDPVAVDAEGARLLGRDWRSIDHLRLADGFLGNASRNSP